MSYTAQDVKKLRDMTGAGMMDCKNALEEAAGDFEKAIEVLRKKGQKMMAKLAGRESNEGVVVAVTNGDRTRGVVVNVCCETDFVTKNEDFVSFVKRLAELALEKWPAGKEALLALSMDGQTVAEHLVEKTGVIGERIELKDFESLEAPQVLSYIHMGYRSGVIVGLNKSGDAFQEAGKNIAMQIAAMKPIAVDRDGIPADVIAKEIEIRKELLRNDPKNEGKTDDILEKMVSGSINKFYQEVALLDQEYVKANKQTVGEYLRSVDKDLTATAFRHLSVK
jgi:elongation factor Ts